jgi:hypothetical protein
MKILGVDPGKTGSCALLDTDENEVTYLDFKFDKNNFLDIDTFYAFIMQNQPDIIVMEKVQGRQGIGATATFTFGSCTGQIINTIKFTRMPFKHIGPKSWQKKMHVGQNSTMSTKEKSQAIFNNLCPDYPLGKKPKQDIIDAFLIAHNEINTFHKWKFNRFQF